MTALQPIAGPAGTNGSGALGVDVWNSQGTPGSVTDWGAVINTLITNGNRLLNFSDHDFPFTTQINLNNKYAITFQGTGGAVHPTVGGTSDRPGARLIWKNGAASGTAISCNGSDGIVFRDMGVVYDNSAYNGDLIQFDFSTTQAANAVLERCALGASDYGGTIRSARSILRWTNAVTCTVEECSLAGAQVAIRGFETTDAASQPTGSQHPDNDRIVHNTFESCATAYIANIGRYWTIEDNEFLFGSLGGFATPTTITSDITCTSDFTYTRNRHWDFANGTQQAIAQLSTNTWTARIRDNFFDTHAAVNVALNGPGHVIVEDNAFTRTAAAAGVALIDLGSSVSAYKNYARVRGNAWSSSSDPSVTVVNYAGHGMVEIGPNGEASGFEARAPEIMPFGGHARAHWEGRYLPSLALAVGQPAISTTGSMQDRFGFIRFTTPASPSVAGKLATVTFGTPLEKGFGQGPPDATHQVALVFVTPYAISNDGVSVAQTIAAGFFAQVTGGQSTTFDIYTNNAIPATTSVGIAYQVVSM